MKTEEEKVQNMIESTFVEIRRAFWKSRETLQVLGETGHADKVNALRGAEDALSKAVDEYAKVLNKGERR